jgi:hypothetical protein
MGCCHGPTSKQVDTVKEQTDTAPAKRDSEALHPEACRACKMMLGAVRRKKPINRPFSPQPPNTPDSQHDATNYLPYCSYLLNGRLRRDRHLQRRAYS